MTKYRVLSAANDLGILDLFFKTALIGGEVKEQFERYMQVEALVKARACSKTEAVKSIAAKMNVDERTIWRTLKELDTIYSVSVAA